MFLCFQGLCKGSSVDLLDSVLDLQLYHFCFIVVEQGFVNIECISPFTSFVTYFTCVNKQPREMNCFQVIFNFRGQFGFENMTEAAVVLLHILVTDDIFAQIFWGLRP